MATLDELKQYSQAFDLSCIYAVHQWLQKFEWSDEATKEMADFLEWMEEQSRTEAELLGAELGRGSTEAIDRDRIVEPHRMDTVIGLCPKCEALLFGQPMPRCEDRATGRVFYKECEKCPYYSEVFKNRKTGEYTEIEGE